MGLFDSNFDLPGISKVNNASVSQIKDSVNFAVSDISTKVNEAGAAMMGTFGDSGPFAKLGANLPSFDSLAASSMQTGKDFLNGTGGAVGSEVDSAMSAADAAPSASAIKSGADVQAISTDHKVRLTDGFITLEFDVMPAITESHTVGYEPVAPAQFPGAFQKYKGSDSVTWTVDVSLVSRTPDEATKNYHHLNTLRGWKQPFFGDNTAAVFPGQLGAPPPVLIFRGLRDLIGPVPVVLTSLNWTWPKDVDYLQTNIPGPDGNFVPFPVIMNIALTLIESYSTKQFNQFNLQSFREGKLFDAFNGEIANSTPTPAVATVKGR